MGAASRDPAAPAPGSVVAFWNEGGIDLGALVEEDKRGCRLIMADGRNVRVTANRVAWTVERPSGDTADVVTHVTEVREAIRDATTRVDVHALWELAHEAQQAGADLRLVELAELALGAGDGVARTAVAQALLKDATRFQRRAEHWRPRTAEQVAAIELQRQRVEQRQHETNEVWAALREAVRAGRYLATGSDHERRVLDALWAVALHGETAPEAQRKLAHDALRASRLRCDTPPEGAFRLLRLAGRIDADDFNLQVPRFALRTRFPDEVLEATARAARRGFDRRPRRDLTAWTTVSIDGPYTVEIDDALSVERLPAGGLRLGVHIADPGAFVGCADAVDDEALARALTHYHPDLRLPMLPPAVSEQAASLVASAERPAVSFLVELDDEGRVLSWDVEPSVVCCDARLDYDEADRALHSGDGAFAELLALLDRAALAREARRREAGAVCLDAAEVDVRLDDRGRVSVRRRDGNSPSRRAVGEAMILVGELTAQHCRRARIPAIYRRQPPPPGGAVVPPGPLRDPVLVRRLRRSLGRGETSLRPARHHGLGLEAYAQASSPLRRFQDLANQRQLLAARAGREPPYSMEQLQRIAATTERAEADARRAERAANDYWILRYLESRLGQTVDGIVVDDTPRPIVQLSQTLWEQPMPSLAGVAPGTPVRLRVDRVNPRAGLLVLARED